MGRDKALLEVDGVPLGRRAVDALREAGAGRVAAVGGRPAHRVLGAELVADLDPGGGPLGGLLTAMAWAPAFPLVSLPCDLPRVTWREVRSLVDDERPADAVIATSGGRAALVAARWSASAVGPLRVAHRAGCRSIRDAIDTLRVVTLEGGVAFADADVPGDLAGSRYPRGMDPVRQLDIDELAALWGDGGPVLDVRTEAEYDDAHVPGAILVPLAELADRIGEVPQGAPLAVICKTGARSQRACELLATQGYDVANVAGGTLAWIDSGHEVATGMERG